MTVEERRAPGRSDSRGSENEAAAATQVPQKAWDVPLPPPFRNDGSESFQLWARR